MTRGWPALRAAAAGAGVGGILALVPLLVVLPRNPWFLDAPGSYLALVSAPLAGLGAAVGCIGIRRAPLALLPASALLGLLAGLGPLLLALWPRPAPLELRLWVFGLDGATFDVLDRLDLPAFRALETEGVRADLRSMEPMVSPLLWTTMASGRRPERHGIHGFGVHATDCTAARFWEPLQAAGLRVGLYKWLVTWPPQEVRGFMVPAWLAPAPDTWPPDLAFVKEIELSRRLTHHRVAARRSLAVLAWEGVRHGIRWSTLTEAGGFALGRRFGWVLPEEEAIQGQVLRTWMDRDVFVWALGAYRPDVATFTDYATDAIQHRDWRAWASEEGGAIPVAYAQADAILDEIRRIAPRARVVVVSDHGFEASRDTTGFAAPRTETLKALASTAVGPVEVARIGHKVVLTLSGEEGGTTRARDRLEAFLSGLVRTSTGRPLFRWEPVPGAVRALGLVLADPTYSERDLATDTVLGHPLSAFVTRIESWSGVHAERGVFLASGPGLARGVRLPDLGLLDVAPILVTLAGVAPSGDLEGRMPHGLLAQDPALPPGPSTWDGLAGHVRPFVAVRDPGAIGDEPLRELGYLD
ncbi:MAG: alkaline phosphatase family protein [Deltaproteobacteria bacterium]|nr:alkaline phosphatase family protein [Deltaproteobacteria bacterium]